MPTYRLEFSSAAERNAREIQSYIELDSPGRATEFTLRLLDRIESLTLYPRRHPRARSAISLGDDVRVMVVTPYKVYYTIVEDVVHILHIRHGARGAPDDV